MIRNPAKEENKAESNWKKKKRAVKSLQIFVIKVLLKRSPALLQLGTKCLILPQNKFRASVLVLLNAQKN